MKQGKKIALGIILCLFICSLTNPHLTFKKLVECPDTECSSFPLEETEDAYKLSNEKEICTFSLFQHLVLILPVIQHNFILKSLPTRYFKIISPPPDFIV